MLKTQTCSTITLIYHLGLYNRPEVAAVPGDVSPTPLKKNCSMQLQMDAASGLNPVQPTQCAELQSLRRVEGKKRHVVLRTGKEELVWGSVSGYWPRGEWRGGYFGFRTP
jgi:hypothetical protein